MKPTRGLRSTSTASGSFGTSMMRVPIGSRPAGVGMNMPPEILVLGTVLGSIGLTRILVWQALAKPYGEHYLLIAMTVACSLIGVVLFGTIAGSMLPFILRRFGFDPASASAPFVATLVDVSGLVIYFTLASIILSGTLL